jgi:proline dehydrogenase
MANAALLRLSRSDRARRLSTRVPAARAVVDRFVAGETEADAVRTVQALIGRGLTATVDRLGEDVTTRARAATTVQAYTSLLDRLADAGAVPAVEVSVKLSALGQGLDDALALDGARRVCEAAARVGTTVSVDMEDHTTVDRTLAAVHALRVDFPWVAAVVQSALRRTPGDLADLVGPGSRVRLVKGAYAEPAAVAHPAKADVDAAYDRCLALLMAGSGHPQVATHDLRRVDRAVALAAEHGRTADSWELQMLYGIRSDEQDRLRALGHQVRVYVPYGADWYAYFVRRLAERPANLAFLARALLHR